MANDKFFDKLKQRGSTSCSRPSLYKWSNFDRFDNDTYYEYYEVTSNGGSTVNANKVRYVMADVKVSAGEFTKVSPVILAAFGRGPRLHRAEVGLSTIVTSSRVYADGVALLEYSFTRIGTDEFTISTSRSVSRKLSFITERSMMSIDFDEHVDELPDKILRMFCTTRQHMATMRELDDAWLLVANNDVRGYVANLDHLNELTGLDYGHGTVTVGDVVAYRPLNGSDDVQAQVSDAKYAFYNNNYIGVKMTFLDANLNDVNFEPIDFIKVVDAVYAKLNFNRLLTKLKVANAEYADAEYAVFDDTLYVLIDGKVYQLPDEVNVNGTTTNDYNAFTTNANARVTERRKMLRELTN